MAVIKGVEDNFDRLTPIDSILFGRGDLLLHDEVADYAIPGIQLLSVLGSGIRFLDPLEIYAPKRGAKVNLANPATAFTGERLFSTGLTFAVNQEKYDASYILTSLSFARRLFQYTTEVSSVGLKLKPDADPGVVKRKLKEHLGDRFRVEDRYEQQADTYRIMRVEKLISYLFLTFILIIACFNVIGSLIMLIIDKRENVETLRHLGADNRQIERIFLYEGCLIVFWAPLQAWYWESASAISSRPTDCFLWAHPAVLWSMPIRYVFWPAMCCWYWLPFWLWVFFRYVIRSVTSAAVCFDTRPASECRSGKSDYR